MEEARETFNNSEPNFVRKLIDNSPRPANLATRNGKYPDEPVRAELVPRAWDLVKKMFFTLDLNGERYAVKSHVEGRYGIFYRSLARW